jgi:hypothetical protein
MGFHRRRLPELSILQSWRAEYNTPREFAEAIWRGADCLMGPVESIRFVEACLQD